MTVKAKFNIYRLRGAIIESGRNIYDICEEIGIYHKGLLKDLARGEMTYVRLYALCSALRITPDDICAVINDDQRRKEA